MKSVVNVDCLKVCIDMGTKKEKNSIPAVVVLSYMVICNITIKYN